jgi:hypothetical protein
MTYLGSPPASQFFAPGTDTFNGDGTTVAFTLSRNVATVNDILVIVNNVEQQPSNYSVSVSTLTFSTAPSSGTANIYVRYLSTNLQTIAPQQGSVYPSSLSTQNAVYWDANANVGIGTTTPTYKLTVNNNGTQITVNNSGGGQFSTIDYANSGVTKGNLYWDQVGTLMVLGTDANAPLLLKTNASERMRIDSSGNVGIGTGSPGSRLDVLGAAGALTAGTIRCSDGNMARLTLQNSNRTWTISNYGSQFSPNGTLNFADETAAAVRLTLDTSGALILAGSTAQKATGTTWSNPSDQRLKNNIRDYVKGTAELMQVRVREWEYNGKGGTTEGIKGLGVVADEVMEVLPNTVENYEAKLNADDEETTAIKKFDATEITWLLVKTVQEQQAMIEELKAKVAALEAR